MKPTRIRMCHSLVMNYGLYRKMEIFVSHCLWPRRHTASSRWADQPARKTRYKARDVAVSYR